MRVLYLSRADEFRDTSSLVIIAKSMFKHMLDLDPEIAAQRLSGTPDRFESADAAFHRRVREGFLAMAVQEPSRWLVLDAARSADDLADEIASHVDAALEGLQR